MRVLCAIVSSVTVVILFLTHIFFPFSDDPTLNNIQWIMFLIVMLCAGIYLIDAVWAFNPYIVLGGIVVALLALLIAITRDHLFVESFQSFVNVIDHILHMKVPAPNRW